MKRVFYLNVFFMITFAVILFFAGCLQPVGKCRYGETPAESGKVKIRQIENVKMNGKTHYKVSVEGFFKRDFFYDESRFERCFKSAGYAAGSELKGDILSGGPCPPVYSLDICRGGK